MEFMDVHRETKSENGGRKYEYRSGGPVAYTTCDESVSIWCNDCNDWFITTPSRHRSGYGCEKCSYEARGKARRKPFELFVKQSLEVHKDDVMSDGSHKFEYDRGPTMYTLCNETFSIYCRVCKKSWLQTPKDHLHGHGCPTCVSTGYSKEQIEWINYMSILTGTKIMHICNSETGEFRIPGTRYHADGHDPDNKCIYEYHGCHCHGCKVCNTDMSAIAFTHNTFAEDYARTVLKYKAVIAAGYKYIYIWSHTWTAMKRKHGLQNLYIYAMRQYMISARVKELEVSEPDDGIDADDGVDDSVDIGAEECVTVPALPLRNVEPDDLFEELDPIDP
jgi:hypothetical protein